MNYHDDCPHCGHRIAAYTQPMNAGLASAFVALADARIRLNAPVPKSELKLTHSQYGNLQKLRHFRLISLTRDGWEVTLIGWHWLQGKASLLSPAGWMGNETLPDDHLAWSTHKARRKEVWVQDVLGGTWKQHEFFALEKRGRVA